MNVDINGFYNRLSKYVASSHTNQSLETMKNDIQNIFKEFGINDSNFSLVSLALNNNSTELSTTSSSDYINQIASRLSKKEERKNKENINQDVFDDNKFDDNKNKSSENKKHKGKPILSFNLASLGKLDPSIIENYFRQEFLAVGYTEEDLNKPNPNFHIFDFNDKSMDLNIDPSGNILEQLTESVKKMYMIMINGEPINAVRNADITNIRENQTTFDHDAPGTENDRSGKVSTNSPNVKVDLSGSGLDIDNDPDNQLDAKDMFEIEQFGIEGIRTHSEMEEFRQTEEYEQLQQLLSNELSRNDDND